MRRSCMLPGFCLGICLDTGWGICLIFASSAFEIVECHGLCVRDCSATFRAVAFVFLKASGLLLLEFPSLFLSRRVLPIVFCVCTHALVAVVVVDVDVVVVVV